MSPNLSREAAARQVPLHALATLVTQKSEAYQHRVSQICGVRGRHTDAISALTTEEEINAYNWECGWDEPES